MNRRYLKKDLDIMSELRKIANDTQNKQECLKKKIHHHLKENPNDDELVKKFLRASMTLEEHMGILGQLHCDLLLSNLIR